MGAGAKPDATSWCQSPLLQRLPWLAHGFATAQAGNVATKDGRQALEQAWASRVGGANPRFYMPQQVHGIDLWSIEEGAACHPAPQADGVLTQVPDHCVAIQTADCVPIILAHTSLGIVAALHAGWRGVAAGILPRFLQRQEHHGARLEGWQLALGPAIGPCCFHVDQDVAQQLAACVPSLGPWQHQGTQDRIGINLWGVLWQQCATLGVQSHQLSILPHCTVCESRWFSFRRQGQGAGRQVSLICRLQ